MNIIERLLKNYYVCCKYRIEMSGSDDEQVKLTSILSRYKSTKGDADKRKETSKDNMAKARAAKLAQLKEKKEKANRRQEIEVSDSESDAESESEEESDSDGEEFVLKKAQKGKGKGRQETDPVDDARLKKLQMYEMMDEFIRQKTNGKKPKPKGSRKTVIQINQAPKAAAQVDPKYEILKQNILRF